MANQYIMALGLDYAVYDTAHARERPSIKAALGVVKPSLPVQEIEKNKAALTFDNYEDAEELIKGIYEYCSDNNESIADENKLYCHIILMAGDASNAITLARTVSLLTSIIERKEASFNYPVHVYITKEIYKKLKPHYQDLYHADIVVANADVHQRYSEDAQRCFVISPIGDEATPIRERANFVFNTYIKPACDPTQFRPVRGEMMRGNLITPELKEALESDPMVIVYLGSPKLGWNPNVMFEFGLRDMTGFPYVVLKDRTSEGIRYNLPFDVKDMRFEDIPEDGQEATSEEEIARTVRTIRTRILDSIKAIKEDHIHPRATINMNVGDPGASKFTWASKETETLFELKGMTGKALLPVIDRLQEKMPDYQKAPFVKEQNALIGQLIVRVGETRNVNATIPIVFKTHKTYEGRAFLPIIAGYSYTKLTSILKLRMIYIDVTSATIWDKDEGHYICALTSKDAKMDLLERS